MARADEQTNVRLPKDLKDWLLTRAGINRRSLTSEIIVHLETAKNAEFGAAKGDGEVIEPTSPSVTRNPLTRKTNHDEG